MTIDDLSYLLRTGVNDLSNGISRWHVSTSIRLKPTVYIFILKSLSTALTCVHEGDGDSGSTTLLFMNTGIVDVEATLRLCNGAIVEQT